MEDELAAKDWAHGVINAIRMGFLTPSEIKNGTVGPVAVYVGLTAAPFSPQAMNMALQMALIDDSRVYVAHALRSGEQVTLYIETYSSH